jgi:hypothetical protein
LAQVLSRASDDREVMALDVDLDEAAVRHRVGRDVLSQRDRRDCRLRRTNVGKPFEASPSAVTLAGTEELCRPRRVGERDTVHRHLRASTQLAVAAEAIRHRDHRLEGVDGTIAADRSREWHGVRPDVCADVDHGIAFAHYRQARRGSPSS